MMGTVDTATTGSPRSPTIADRIYERLGSRYLSCLGLLHWLFAMVCGASFDVVAGIPYLHLTAGQFWSGFAVGEVGLTAAVIGCDLMWLRRARTVRVWIETGRPIEGAATAWRSAVRLPLRFPMLALAWGAALSAIPITVWAWQIVGVSAFDLLVGVSAVLAGGVYLTVFSYLALDLLMRPVLRDLASRLSPEFALGAPGVPLAQRLLLVQIVIGGAGGAFVGLGISLGSGSIHQVGAAIGATVLATLTVGLALALLFNRAFAEPVRDLLDATRRVKAGDLFARVTPVTDDEHGVLAISFNEMTEQLQRSRTALVTSREEERRRLRRDLHDGLGPVLSGLAMRLEAARGLVSRDPSAVESLLEEMRCEAVKAISDVRHLVHGLRPPQLDEFGLIGAIEERASRLAPPGAHGGMRITIEAPAVLPQLPAALEVAAYRITEEALTNVLRHAQASNCAVRVAADNDLVVEIRDNGTGIADGRSVGVGLNSMRERASEVGGSCTVEPGAEGGTVVCARFPRFSPDLSPEPNGTAAP